MILIDQQETHDAYKKTCKETYISSEYVKELLNCTLMETKFKYNRQLFCSCNITIIWLMHIIQIKIIERWLVILVIASLSYRPKKSSSSCSLLIKIIVLRTQNVQYSVYFCIIIITFLEFSTLITSCTS